MGSGICFPYWIWQVLKPSVVFLFLTVFHQNSYTLNLNNVENPNGSGFLGYYTSVDGWFITVYITMDDENSQWLSGIYQIWTMACVIDQCGW